MQFSYRGCAYTSTTAEVSTTEQAFEGQFLGISRTLNATIA